MATKKKKHGKMPGYRKIFKTVMGIGSKLLFSVPITVPGIVGVTTITGGGTLQAGMNSFVYEAVGYNMTTKKVESAKVGEVIFRDSIAMLGGMLARWAGKKI